VFIDNKQNVFPGISGAEWVNILLWREGYDNHLQGKQLVYTNGENPSEVELLIEKAAIEKPKEIEELKKLVVESKIGFISIDTYTSSRKPYGLTINPFDSDEFTDTRQNENDILVFSGKFIKYLPQKNSLIKEGMTKNMYKIFVPYAWGNMDEKAGLGGAFADIYIAKPNEICTETFLTSGCFTNVEIAQLHAKYMMTKFLRALLYANKCSHHSTTAWVSVPKQDYTESWWNESIESINEHLFEKYEVPQHIRDFVNKNIQTKDESNIRNIKR
jgi:hypothetical protein